MDDCLPGLKTNTKRPTTRKIHAGLRSRWIMTRVAKVLFSIYFSAAKPGTASTRSVRGNQEPKNMVRLLTIIFGLIFSLFISAQQHDKVVRFSGKISDRYSVKMILNIHNNKILGYYYYDKYKTNILLEGLIKGNQIVLNESTDLDTIFKIGFKGTYSIDKINVNWIDKTKGKVLNCKLKLDTSYYDIASPFNGYYENINNSNGFNATIDLNSIVDNLFCFNIIIGTENCTGNLKGLIDFSNINSGVYSDKVCQKLEINFQNDTLTIVEKKCDWHGMSCSFKGKYKKIK